MRIKRVICWIVHRAKKRPVGLCEQREILHEQTSDAHWRFSSATAAELRLHMFIALLHLDQVQPLHEGLRRTQSCIETNCTWVHKKKGRQKKKRRKKKKRGRKRVASNHYRSSTDAISTRAEMSSNGWPWHSVWKTCHSSLSIGPRFSKRPQSESHVYEYDVGKPQATSPSISDAVSRSLF